MIIGKRLKGKAIAAWLGTTGDVARRAAGALRERLGNPRQLAIYLDIADAWSYLTAQAAARLVETYRGPDGQPIDLAIHAVTPPASDVDPAPTLRPAQAVRDARQLADYWDLDFPAHKEADPGMVRDVGTALVRERPAAEQLRCALELLDALWRGDRKTLGQRLLHWGTEAHVAVPPVLNNAYAELRKAGHYQGAMMSYKGAWYWGIDRLPYLEAELAKDLGVEVRNVVSPRPLSERGPLTLTANTKDARPLACELWFSFRSPYSYLALEQIEAALAPFGVPVVLRPVLPMVTRGLSVPTVKRLYIVRDAKREADRLGIPFGEICDPLGAGVDHCIALVHWAGQRGPDAAMAFARSAMRGIWSEARDPAEYVDLRDIVERAHLPWDEAKAALANAEAHKVATANAADLTVAGLWGVPSFRCGDFVAWGQDRIPLLVDRLRRNALPLIPS